MTYGNFLNSLFALNLLNNGQLILNIDTFCKDLIPLLCARPVYTPPSVSVESHDQLMYPQKTCARLKMQ